MLTGISLSDAWKFVNGLPHPFDWILEGLIVIVVGAGLVWGLVGKVDQGKQAMKQRLGRVVRDKDGNVRYYNPGRLVFAIKGFHSLVPVGILKRQIELDEMPIDVADYVQVLAKAVANFRAVDIYGIEFEVEDLEPYLASACEDALTESVIDSWQGATDSAFKRRVKTRFKVLIEADAADVGAELWKLSIKYTALNPLMAIAKAVADKDGPVEPTELGAAVAAAQSIQTVQADLPPADGEQQPDQA